VHSPALRQLEYLDVQGLLQQYHAALPGSQILAAEKSGLIQGLMMKAGTSLKLLTGLLLSSSDFVGVGHW